MKLKKRNRKMYADVKMELNGNNVGICTAQSK